MSNQASNQRGPGRARTTATAAMAALVMAAAASAAHGQATTGPAGERFVADGATVAASGTLSLRSRVVVSGAEMRLRDVCRWSVADAPAFAPLADLVLDHMGEGGTSRELTVDTLRATLREAGVNLGTVRLTGATACIVTRDITAVSTAAAAPATEPTAEVASATVAPSASAAAKRSAAADAECNPFHTLRDRLIADAAQRLNVPAGDLQVTFTAADATLLNLTEPTFRFELDGRRVHDLGKVTWDVTVMNGPASQKATVSADARVWQTQLVLTAAAGYHQILRDADVVEQRVLVAELSPDTLLTRKQAVGQPAARDLKPGAVLTGRMIDPLPLAKVGEMVTVTLCQGGVQVRTVARALQGGTYGQTIKVKNEATRDEFEVTLTGPQVATIGQAPGDANLASVRD